MFVTLPKSTPFFTTSVVPLLISMKSSIMLPVARLTYVASAKPRLPSWEPKDAVTSPVIGAESPGAIDTLAVGNLPVSEV